MKLVVGTQKEFIYFYDQEFKIQNKTNTLDLIPFYILHFSNDWACYLGVYDNCQLEVTNKLHAKLIDGIGLGYQKKIEKNLWISIVPKSLLNLNL